MKRPYWLVRLRAWITEGQDSALTVTGIRQCFSGYDYEQAKSSHAKWLTQTPRGRVYERKDAGQ